MAPTVLITGASQGIGRATALLFARNGYNLVLAARQPDRLEAFAQELKSLNYSAIAIPTDTKEPQQVKNLVRQALAEYGAIDVLINNAGIYASGSVDSFSLEGYRSQRCIGIKRSTPTSGVIFTLSMNCYPILLSARVARS